MLETQDTTELGNITSRYRDLWKAFEDEAFECTSTTGEYLNLPAWSKCDWDGSTIASASMANRPRAATMLRLARSFGYDSLGYCASPMEVAYILHRCALVKAMACASMSMRGLAYGMALASGRRLDKCFVSRLLHGIHMHDGFCHGALMFEHGQMDQGISNDRYSWSTESMFLHNWLFRSPSSDNLCGMSPTMDLQASLKRGQTVRPKKTEVAALLKTFSVSAMGSAIDNVEPSLLSDFVPTHEVKIRGSYKQRQVVPAITWAKLLALAPRWRFFYGDMLASSYVHDMAEMVLDRYCRFRRRFIIRTVDAGGDATLASSVFTRAMENGLAAYFVGACITPKPVDTVRSGDQYDAHHGHSVRVLPDWVERAREQFGVAYSRAYSAMEPHEKVRHGHIRIGEACSLASDTHRDIVMNDLVALMPVPRNYVDRYAALLTSFHPLGDAE